MFQHVSTLEYINSNLQSLPFAFASGFPLLRRLRGVPSIPWSGDGLTAILTAEGTIPDETFKMLGWQWGLFFFSLLGFFLQIQVFFFFFGGGWGGGLKLFLIFNYN